MSVDVYKQEEIKFKVAGITVNGIREESSIKVEFDRERISKTIDVNGGGLFNLRAGKPAKITVPILVNSKWNTILANYRNTGKMVPVSLMDMNKYSGRMNFVSGHAMIQDPGFDYGAEAGEVEYIFEVIHLSDISLP